MSLPFVGYVILKYVSGSKKIPTAFSLLAQSVLRQNIFVIVFVSFVLTIGLSLLLIIPGYFLKVPIALLSSVYLVVLTACVGYTALTIFYKKKRFFGLSGLTSLFKRQTLMTKLSLIGLVVFLTFDYIMSLYVKTNADGDTLYHLARINAIVHEGLTIMSGHYSQLPDASYHYNVIYPLYAIPASLLGLPPMEVSKWSLGFFRFVQWASIFTLALYVAQKWMKYKNPTFIAAVSTIFAIALLSGDMFIATYPNKVVLLWLTLFVIGVSLYESGMRRMMVVPLFMLALLATTTHANAMMGTLFIGVLFLYKLLTTKGDVFRQWRSLLVYVALAVTFMIGPLATALMPSYLNEEQQHLGDFPVVHILGMVMRSPIADIIAKGPVEIIGMIVSIIGVLVIVRSVWRNKAQLSIVLTLTTFYAVVMYVPPVFTVLSHFLPLWAIDRFSAMNILIPILFPVGVCAILGVWKVAGKRLKNQAKEVIFATVIVVVAVPLAFIGYTQFNSDRDYKMAVYGKLLSADSAFSSVVGNNAILLGDPGATYELPAVLSADAIAVHAGHSTSTADTSNRELCRDYMLTQLKYEDLKATGVSFVVNAKAEASILRRDLLDRTPYLQKVAENDSYALYAFTPSSIPTDSGSGTIYPPCGEYLDRER